MECLLCLGVTDELKPNINYPFEEYLKVCQKYLTIDVSYEFSKQFQSSICTVCYCSVETLYKIHKQLQDVQEKLAEYSISFSQILTSRRCGKSRGTSTFNDEIVGSNTAEEIKLELEANDHFPSEDDSLHDGDFGDNDDNHSHFSDFASALPPTNFSPQLESSMKEAGTNQDIGKSSRRLVNRSTNRKINLRSRISKSTNDKIESTSEADSETDEDDANVLFGCWKCPKKFKTREEFDMHSRSHILNLSVYSCDICEETFPSKTKLENHIVVVHDLSTFECKICGKMYKRERDRNTHETRHTSTEKAYKCNMCEKSYFWSYNLLTHKRNAHSHNGNAHGQRKAHRTAKDKSLQNIKTFCCEQCGKTFTNKTLFEGHRRIHTGEMPFKCDINDCGKTFRLQMTLQHHKIVNHSNNFPFVCPQENCNRKFRYKYELTTHSNRKHSTLSEKVKCTDCNKQFIDRDLLRRHVRNVHLKESWPHVCNICGVRRLSKMKLEIHIRSHRGENPLECGHCKKHFVSKKRLGQHRQEMGH